MRSRGLVTRAHRLFLFLANVHVIIGDGALLDAVEYFFEGACLFLFLILFGLPEDASHLGLGVDVHRRI